MEFIGEVALSGMGALMQEAFWYRRRYRELGGGGGDAYSQNHPLEMK